MEAVPSAHSHIAFNNRIDESDTLNVMTFEYIYNGGGIGVGDFDNDGLSDLFFAGNMTSSRLYLNKGDLAFEDITAPAGITTASWCTGVSTVDIDQDGWLDVYVSTVHPDPGKSTPNLLFRNKGLNADGIPEFEEVAAKVGLADMSYTTQAAFFDYDLDGDLDMYLLTNALENYTRNSPIGQKTNGLGKSVDKLFRNEGMQGSLPVFTDVSREAGILTEGWGLGIVVNDTNLDGYPDVYVANDFLSNDHLYVNNRDGTFSNTIAAALKHQEYNGMGADIGDVNNDGLADILVVDMMPDDNLRQKTMFAATGYDKFQKNLQMKYQPQYVRNVLQLNNGNGTFSDIGYMSGIYATDWSWSALISDLDNDRRQDIVITNGYRKDITDLDFIAYNREAAHFGTQQERMKNVRVAIEKIEGVKKPDVIFHNDGDLHFTNVSATWGMKQESYGNGAAYADLDGDGDLDLVINNINDEASLYRNNSVEMYPERSHYLRVRLKGDNGNHQGIGARVSLYAGDSIQVRDYNPQRGYQSTVEPFLHFGLQEIEMADSLTVTWPGGRRQVIRDVRAGQVIVLKYEDALPAAPVANSRSATLLHRANVRGLSYKHDETVFIDFKSTATLPRKYSEEGPALAVGDINLDGLDDLVICGAANRHAVMYFQQQDGSFRLDSLPAKAAEDAGILLFDCDGDGDLDLYCVSGSSEFRKDPGMYQDRLYRNSGGKFAPDEHALPSENSSGSVVTAADYDRDGDLDLFVGGRIVPGRYPEAPGSFILQNDGKGNFSNVTVSIAPALGRVGMVTGALWTDVDNDGWIDLAVAGEWMPVTFFRNNQGRSLTKMFESPAGWWNSIAGGDFDHDGDTDYVCGNLGLNAIFTASAREPVTVYAKDFDDNGSFDPLIARYIQGAEYLVHPRETLTDQIAAYKRRLNLYSVYGKSTRKDLLPEDQLKGSVVRSATLLSSSFFRNDGNGKFTVTALPVQAQVTSLKGLQVADVNGDGNQDVLAVGNDYSMDPLAGYLDAGIGVVLLGDGAGHFSPEINDRSGFVVDGNARALVRLRATNGDAMWIASANGDSLRVFTQGVTTMRWVQPGADDVLCEWTMPSGKKERLELYYGGGYLSQSARGVLLPVSAGNVVFTKSNGERSGIRND